ncbi:MAG: TonB-dependent receptor [Sediminibacterium sp.]|nr:TonB-dependent receptor [Sediminibacterium sp.]
MKFFLTALLAVSSILTMAQQPIKGTVVDASTNLSLEGVVVTLLPDNRSVVTDIRGQFICLPTNQTTHIYFSSIGYQDIMMEVGNIVSSVPVAMKPGSTQLKQVTVRSQAGEEYKTISKTDIRMRGVNNSQEILRMVPGLFIGQHQGGGKAEQIFIRGFDCDHGTDINITADGIPVNMVSQAHGQGYADMHFVIPETIEQVDFQKGPYDASKGNFTTSGFVDIRTRNGLGNNTIKLEGGMFDTYRALAMFNLLNERAKEKQQSLYVAGEMAYSNGFFESPQHFNRFNFFLKYNGKISGKTYLTFSASSFSSKWDASGQIPDRAVADGSIGFYGAIDNSEGGNTQRQNLNAQFITTLKNGNYFKNQLWYSRYRFNLHSNFTFYLDDPVNGDQIRQSENRNLMGYNGSYHFNTQLGAVQLSSVSGIGLRHDQINDLELSHTVDRNILLNRKAYGDVAETNLYAYQSETIRFSDKFSINLGLRYDQLLNNYKDHLRSDSSFRANAGILSPKLSFHYQSNKNTRIYLNLGKGFHSNDTRVAVLEKGREVMPAAYSADLGVILKPAKNVLLHGAMWYLWLNQEFVYSGDGAYVEPSGRTQRTGFDFSIRYEPVKSVYVDVDLNYAHGRMVDEVKGNNYIPLAPVWSSTGGIMYKNKTGINGSIRYRWLGNRPANEDYSIIAKGYFVNDLVLNYTQAKYEIGLTIQNMFNVKWKETQFATLTRLKNEIVPVEEIHFTPGTKLAAKISLSFFF